MPEKVLEIVRYDPASGACVVASGWGGKSAWFHNVTANPKIFYQVQNRRRAGVAERLSPEEGARELSEYARRYPLAFRELAHFMGYRLDGSPADIRAVGRILPMFRFIPASG